MNDDKPIKTIRKLNFERIWQRWLAAGSEGERRTLKMFAAELGKDKVHLSQIKNGSRNIGTRLARSLEKAVTPKLPDGWMDREHRDCDPTNQAEQELTALLLTLYRQNPRRTAAALKAMSPREVKTTNKSPSKARR